MSDLDDFDMLDEKEEYEEYEDRRESLAEIHRKKRKRAIRREIISWIRLVAIVIAAVFVIKEFIILNAKVPSGSMEDTIETGDRLIAFRFSYWFSDPQRGDIILFKYPVDEKTIYVKRVIGLPGETVEIRGGEVYIDGSTVALDEEYLKEEWTWQNDGYTFEVPEDCYFVMGDNRNNSLDSRFWADEAISAGVAADEAEAAQYTYVRRDEVMARAAFTYFPHISWLMGDAYAE